MIANRAWQRWQLLDLLEEIQLRSSQEEQQAQNRCSLLSRSATVYTAETPCSPLANWTQKKITIGIIITSTFSAPSQLSVIKSSESAIQRFSISLYAEWMLRCIWRLVITRSCIQSCERCKNMIIEETFIKKTCYYAISEDGLLSKSSKAKASCAMYSLYWNMKADIMEEFQNCNRWKRK